MLMVWALNLLGIFDVKGLIYNLRLRFRIMSFRMTLVDFFSLQYYCACNMQDKVIQGERVCKLDRLITCFKSNKESRGKTS
jgi:hypothetical protein